MPNLRQNQFNGFTYFWVEYGEKICVLSCTPQVTIVVKLGKRLVVFKVFH